MTDLFIQLPDNSLAPSARGSVILLVEDEVPLLTLIQGILERAGFVVLPATSGTEALTVWESHAADIGLLFTDMMLPDGIPGWELASRLQARKPGLMVIFTSGHCQSMWGEETAPLVEGVNFLAKPYRPQTLVQTVRAYLKPVT